MGIARAVTLDQLGIVEVVAGEHRHPGRQATAHLDLPLLVQQRELDALDLVGMGPDD